MSYVLHYAPDNASLIIRLALEYRGLPYTTQLVDRARADQRTPAYLTLNPNGLIPVLETPQGPLFETGAILLWLADRHGGLGPVPGSPRRGDFLKWLFYVSNTLHPALRMLFYPATFITATAVPALHAGLTAHLLQCYGTLDDLAATRPDWFGASQPTVLDFYAAGLLRWPVLYPRDADRSWFDLSRFRELARIAAHLQALPCTHAVQQAEGLGARPFTAPQPPNPPEGSAI